MRNGSDTTVQPNGTTTYNDGFQPHQEFSTSTQTDRDISTLTGNSSDPDLPGISAVTSLGFNLKTLDYTANSIFQINYSQGKTVRIGPQSTSYKVPDNLTVIPKSIYTNKTMNTVMLNEEQIDRAYSVKVSGSGSGLAWSGSFDSSLAYTSKLFTSSQHEYLLDFTVQTIYNIQRQSQLLEQTSAFKSAAKNLPNDSNGDNLKIYFSFFDDFGTHYIDKADMGGYMVAETTIDKQLLESNIATDIAASVSGSYKGMIASGTLSASTVINNSDFLKSHRSQTSVNTTTVGGMHTTDISAWISSCYLAPVLLVGPGGNTFEPTLMSICDLLPANKKQAALAALAQYLSEYLIGPTRPTQGNSSNEVNSDIFSIGYIDLADSASGPRMQGYGEDEGTETLASASAHYYPPSDRWCNKSSFILPVKKGDNSLINDHTTFGVGQASFYRARFGEPNANKSSLGSGQDPQLTGTWSKSGFLIANIDCSDGDRGSITYSKIEAEQEIRLGACSAHEYHQHDVWYPRSSFMVPVHAGDQYKIEKLTTSGSPNYTFQYIPFADDARLDFGDVKLLKQSIAYQAKTDCLVVCSLNANVNGVRGFAEIKTGSNSRSLFEVTGTSVHNYEQADNHILFNSATLPVAKGEFFQVDVINTSGTVDSVIYQVPLTLKV